MIGYVTLGTNNLERAAAFYDALLTEFDAKCIFHTKIGLEPERAAAARYRGR